MEVVVDIGAALICFSSMCFNALVGTDTPKGEFMLDRRGINDIRYGGELLVYKHDKKNIFAIHQVIAVRGQHRSALLAESTAKERRRITGGCINVTSEVYQQLIDCCSDARLVIK